MLTIYYQMQDPSFVWSLWSVTPIMPIVAAFAFVGVIAYQIVQSIRSLEKSRSSGETDGKHNIIRRR